MVQISVSTQCFLQKVLDSRCAPAKNLNNTIAASSHLSTSEVINKYEECPTLVHHHVPVRTPVFDAELRREHRAYRVKKFKRAMRAFLETGAHAM